MDDKVLWLWLQNAVGCGCPHSAALWQQFGDAASVYAADEAALRRAGVSGALLKNLKNKSLVKAEKIAAAVAKNGWHVLTPDDEAYPDGWANLPDLPLAVYVDGPLPDRSGRLTVTVVGTRKISEEGRHLTGGITAGLAAAGCLIVGDTIAGGDEAAMAAVVKVGGRAVILQPCGLDVSYPKRGDDLRNAVLAGGGTILSEFPPSTPVRRENYGLRNRLMATFSDVVLVTEAGEKSGTVRVANLATAAGHEVLAVPGDRAQNAGCHKLIREGATLVESSDEILRAYAPSYPRLDRQKGVDAEKAYLASPPPKPKPKPAFRPDPPRERVKPYVIRQKAQPAPTETVAFPPLPEHLSENAKTIGIRLRAEPQSAEQLMEDTTLSMPQVLTALTELELYGVATGFPGGRYSRKG